MCPGTCADFLCADCRKAAREDKQGAADFVVLSDAVGCSGANVDDACIQARELRSQLAKAEGDAEAHRMRCASLDTQLETAKRAGLESDRRAHEARAAALEEAAALCERTRCRDWDAIECAMQIRTQLATVKP